MSKLPRVAGLILCKRMEMNPAEAELSLVGLFHSLSFSVWPTLAPLFTVYTEVYDAEAEGIMELVLMRLETEKEIYFQRKWFASSDRQLTYRLEWRVSKCVFPAPGRYLLKLRLDRRELSRRYLEVRTREKAP